MARRLLGLPVKLSPRMNPDEVHVLPIGDLRSHDEHTDCWCKPAVDGLLVIHNAMDGRELVEQHGLM